MTLSLPTALDTAVRLEVATLCHLLKITRQDGSVVRITDADFDIFDGTDMWRSDIGFTASALLIGVNLNQVQGFSLTIGLLDDGITKADLKARRYDAAEVLYYMCDFKQPTDSKFLLFKGHMGRSTITDVDKAVIEVVPFTNDDAKFADQVYSQTCRHSLGDAGCAFPLESFRVDFTVEEVTGRSAFVLDTFGPSAAGRPDLDYFAQGQLKWLTGNNAEWECDVLRSNTPALSMILFFPTPTAIQVGDTGKLYPGCNRQASTCASKFDNILNFDGEPFAPQWG
jgi:uncharacterized phage protein (TIGR02218 family)